jgi:RNA polymerase sigma-70 factor, ECF subfamily
VLFSEPTIAAQAAITGRTMSISLTSKEQSTQIGPAYSAFDDLELIRLCQERDRRAFAELVKRHQRTIYALFYRLAPDWSDISDLSQEVLIRIWLRIPRLREPKAFKSWVTQIVTHLFYDELRKRPRQLPTISMDAMEFEDSDARTHDVVDPKDGPEQLYARMELSEVVNNAMSSLPEQFRTAIVLRELQGLSYEEIASSMNCDVGTVKSRIHRARLKIQSLIAPIIENKQAAA